VTTAETALALAAGALALAVLLLVFTLVLWLRVRRMRRAQRLVLSGREQDLVEYAVGLLTRVEAVEAGAARLEDRVSAVSRELAGCLQRRALVRYDALRGAGAKQSVSIALLDASASGLVVSAIQGRDYARIYIKGISDGASDVELSPEERAVVREALAA
jgi:hypothetical protein